ncbi:DUF5107 domain-containing protein [Pareuzebyella sediminis]|uniref:DUF5107 domain-containing protein n=1 Tax=Pareuzebyella sediminis TaxID=2607998 RepID=UPI0011F0874C|nr:DUF5107 domain-containing protein [Pareuzebyella sediminis]
MKTIRHTALFLLCIFAAHGTHGQSVTIKEENLSLDTYGFGKPNPVPILSENPKIFPYFKFEQYDHKATKKDWKVVTLENQFIKVMVLPEMGGKVWGAIEKSTGHEFLYKNEVIKFRNIAMRGPWTSGGIEFNFGIIGHHPSTATPVDYKMRTNPDGSVSCIVGNIDLPSNTKWQVEIRLESDKAYFETNAFWYNGSPLTESYYNWMTGAAVATDDLEFFIPGNAYVGHNGNAHSWPIDDKNRNLAFYKNNNFGGSKSYHVVGEFNDFFGGYYHNTDFGFGQWAPYEEMPGQKLWLWALSRSGGIWEDLLTDSDGQYIEFQAGRLLDQYSGGVINPISQVGFDPFVMDKWNEIWFPYKDIGGMVDASPHGVLNVSNKEGELYIGLNALQTLNHDMIVTVNEKKVFQQKLNMEPMEIFSKTLVADASDKVTVSIQGTELYFSNHSQKNTLKRPFYTDESIEVSASEKLLDEGTEALEYRDFKLALDKFLELLKLDPSHRKGLQKLAELEYRSADYKKALESALTVLRMDTYDSGANYIAGITYRALNDSINALESLGWAARDIKYRTVSYAQMAEIYLASKNYNRAENYARKALDFNTYNLNARKVLLVVNRKKDQEAQFTKELEALLEIDPLNHFAMLEQSFADAKEPRLHITNEFSVETILGLSLEYKALGLMDEAIKILELNQKDTKSKLWMAYLLREKNLNRSAALLDEVQAAPIDFVFPYRRETLPVLEWAFKKISSWKFGYFLAQNYLALGQTEEGYQILTALSDTPDSDIFYRFRAGVVPTMSFEEKAADYEKALDLGQKDWKVWEEVIQFYLEHKHYEKAYGLSRKGYKSFPSNYNIGLAHAKALLNTDRAEKTIEVLKTIEILPYEHASESRSIYERAHLSLANSRLKAKKYARAIEVLEASKKWPENIGVGKPYDPDERAQDYLLAVTFRYIGETEKNLSYLEKVVSFTKHHVAMNSLNHLYGLLALRALGRQQELNMVLEGLRKQAKTDQKTKLAVALFEDETNDIDTLKSGLAVPVDVFEVAKWAVKEK